LSNGVHRSLALINITVFAVSVGLGSYIYFVPVFAQSLGATYVDLGVIGTANAIPYAIFPLIVGYFADRLNRARVYLIGVLFNALATFLLVFASSVSDVIIFRMIGGTGLALFWPTAETLISDIADPELRLKAMGRFSVSYSSGFLIGPAIGGFISQTLGFSQLFLMATTEIIFGAVLVGLIVVPRYVPVRTPATKQIGINSSFVRGTLPMFSIVIPYSLVFSVIVTIFPGYLSAIGIGKPEIGILFATFGISRIVAYNYSWRFSTFGEKRAILLVSLLLFTSFYLIASSASAVAFALPMILVGISLGVFFPVTISTLSKQFPKERLGMGIGIYESFFGIGFAVGPFIAGLAANFWNPTAPYFLMSVISLSLIPLLAKWKTRGIQLQAQKSEV